MMTATVVRRGRPRNLERRRTIAREAIALFAEHGYDGCTMRSVATNCGMGKTLLARYFARKELLLAEAVTYAHDRLVAAAEELRTAAARGGALREFLFATGTIYMRHVHEMCSWYVVRLGGLPLDEEQHRKLRLAEESLYAPVAAFVSRRGAPTDAYVFARTFLGALHSLVLMQNRAAFEPSTDHLRNVFLEQQIELLLSGIVRKEGG